MSRLKLYAHTHFPKGLVSILENLMRLKNRRSNRMREQEAHERRIIFERINSGSNRKRIVMRKGVSFNVHEEAYESFQWFCWRSEGMVYEYDQFLADCVGKRRFLDVGACHGVYSLSFLLLNPEGRSLIIEPSPIARDILTYNITMNKFSNRATIIPDAVGEEAGLMYAEQNWHHYEARLDIQGTIAINTRSIDCICKEHEYYPDIIKIDVEGFELHALRGAMNTISKRPVLYVEIHPTLTANLGYDHTACFDLIREIGYIIQESNGKLISRQDFSSRHHTFFTVCR